MRDGNILPSIEERQQIVGLKNESNLLKPEASQVLTQPPSVIDLLTIERQLPGIGFENTPDDVKQRTLA